MLDRSLMAGIVLGIIAVAAGPLPAQISRQAGPNQGGYLPWHGRGFGGYAVAGPAASQQGPVYDLAPAIAQAAFARTQFDNRWIDLQLMLTSARSDFYVSSDYLTARKEVEQARTSFEAARDAVLARLQSDRTYKDVIEKRTQEEISLKLTGEGSGLRNAVAVEKMRYGAMASEMEAVALADDPAVQDAKGRLVAAQETLTLKERQFRSQLYTRTEIAAARQAMETARENKAGAEGFLRGAEITRADELNLNFQNYSGNLVGGGPWWP